MKKRLLCAAMCVIMLLTLTPNVFALKNGDVVDSVLHTDIVTYINEKPIESYNIKGYTAIKVEDLMEYGFQVAWNSAERTLKVTRPDNRAVTGNYTIVPNTYPVGSYWMDVYYTDIKTYFDGNEVPSYNIGGMTIAYVDDLAEYFAAPGKYIWDGAARTLSLTLRGSTGTSGSSSAGTSGSGSATATPAPTTPAPAATPLTIISQPQNVNAIPNATVSFKVVAAGGTAPYTYKWELRSASDLVWTDAGCAEATYSFTASQSIIDKGYLFRCIVTDAAGSGVYSEIAQLLGQAVVPLTIVADPADQIADTLYTALSFTVTAQGGVPAYTYEWQISTDGVNWITTGTNNLQTYNLAVTPEMIASVMYVRCAVSDSEGQKAYSKAATVIGIAAGTPGTGAGTPAPSTVTKSAVVNATVGVDFKQTFKYSDYGIPTGTASSEPTVNPTIEYGLKASFSSTELTIEGKPTKAGNANYRLSVTSGSTIYYLVINMVITASSSSSPSPIPTLSAVVKAEKMGSSGTKFTVTVTGGKGPYTYDWKYNGSSFVSSMNGKTELAVLNDPYLGGSITCVVTDSFGTKVTSNSVSVIAQLTASIYCPYSAVSPGNSAAFTCTASGGSGGYTYIWQTKEEGQFMWGIPISGNGGSSFTLKNITKKTQVKCEVRDSSGQTKESNVLEIGIVDPSEIPGILKPIGGISIGEGISVSGPKLNITCNMTGIKAGQEAVFTATASGGAGGYKYAWYLNDISTSVGSGSTFKYKPSIKGTLKVTCVVTDANGLQATANYTTTVY